MYEISVTRSFSAAHNLRGYQGSCEELHGHNWQVEISLGGEELDELGMLIDFKVAKQALDEALSELDHHYLNDIPPFDRINPSSENMARHLYEQMSRRLNDARVRVVRCRVWESEGSCAAYTE